MADPTEVKEIIKRFAGDPKLLDELNRATTSAERQDILTAAGLPILTYEDLRDGIKALISKPAAGSANPSVAAQTGTTTEDDVAAITAAACSEGVSGSSSGCSGSHKE